ncbi:undecaprenyl-phosphate N-acetylglucosaminyl 1-phosphate transferase [Vibrio maritimus]|uniref:Undecaprenyl-phosphate N-acetylglucosaminyl 1-phosphate transferase n=1 Tax=Vibrio maritimus TaxID=990268 RepID=A0A090TE18_9VIBR|nr:undecaprenyl-phosphate N-acetylglucosaminyl 1-phosphate transferase [Vibrio maritimus]
MDMIAIMARLMKKGQSPIALDRGHLHHIFQRIGFNSRQTLLIITAIATVFAFLGIIGELAVHLNQPCSTYSWHYLVAITGYYQ